MNQNDAHGSPISSNKKLCWNSWREDNSVCVGFGEQFNQGPISWWLVCSQAFSHWMVPFRQNPQAGLKHLLFLALSAWILCTHVTVGCCWKQFATLAGCGMWTPLQQSGFWKTRVKYSDRVEISALPSTYLDHKQRYVSLKVWGKFGHQKYRAAVFLNFDSFSLIMAPADPISLNRQFVPWQTLPFIWMVSFSEPFCYTYKSHLKPALAMTRTN